MTIEQWLEDAKSDAYRRKLPELADMLDGLGRATSALRGADWNEDAAGSAAADAPTPTSATWKAPDAAPPAADVARVEPLGPTITALAPRIACGEITSERITEEALDVISKLNPRLNAFITIVADEALIAARTADKAIAAGRHLGPLHGIPISLKDLIDLADVPTTAASRLRDAGVS